MKEENNKENVASNIALIRTNILEEHTHKDIRIFGVCDENKNETTYRNYIYIYKPRYKSCKN